MNADPVVMEHFPSVLTTEASDAFVDRIEACFAERGWGLWAVDFAGSFAGYVGLWPVPPTVCAAAAIPDPSVEVGWRLAHRFWGQGIAPEAATAAVADGFRRVGLDEIVSFTAVVNVASQRVMQKIGMDIVREFDHPAIAEGRLRRHVLYRIASVSPRT